MDKNTAVDELNYIKKIISDSKRTAIDNGIGFIVWGILIAIALFGNYLTVKLEYYSWGGFIWIVTIAAGWIFTAVDSYRCRNKRSTTTFAGQVLGSLWLSLGVVMTIIGFLGSYSGALKGVYIAAFISLQIGIGFFVTGTIYKNKYMTYLGPLWWIGAVSMMYFPGIHVLLQMGIMMLLLQVIPGIIIYKKYLAEKKAEL